MSAETASRWVGFLFVIERLLDSLLNLRTRVWSGLYYWTAVCKPKWITCLLFCRSTTLYDIRCRVLENFLLTGRTGRTFTVTHWYHGGRRETRITLDSCVSAVSRWHCDDVASFARWGTHMYTPQQTHRPARIKLTFRTTDQYPTWHSCPKHRCDKRQKNYNKR